MVANTPQPGPKILAPPDEQIPRVINDLINQNYSFMFVAELHHTTVEALTLWMSRPDVAARLDAFEAATARRIRLITINGLPAAIIALNLSVSGYTHEESNVPINDASIKQLEQRRRSRETARRAISLLMRIARFQAGPSASAKRDLEPNLRALLSKLTPAPNAPPH